MVRDMPPVLMHWCRTAQHEDCPEFMGGYACRCACHRVAL